ncbi:SIR2 family protein [Rhizobium leguminosarum]
MRFTANGPSIPDELLWARDQGRVVFFCGAGVSLAKAGLPDFFGLAEKVIAQLRIPADSSIVKILGEAREIGGRTGVDGLISADRVFGLLERDFSQHDINSAVAAALKPGVNCDRTAHETLVQLATTREGLVRIVTTNFDRVFDDCKSGLKSFQPPHLPNPARPKEMDGIIYLHGKATSTYDGAEEDGFVLSSSEFGRAYLSDAWATSFIREVIARYVVVFVGYGADDPPVQYLLEALNKTNGNLEGVYALQSGEAHYATMRWRHKGVQAIPYDPAERHAALWSTLEKWAERAKSPDAWIRNVVNSAMEGPEKLEPHQRGQVAHLVGTIEGTRALFETDSPPPATWLSVFDARGRYAKPERQKRFDDETPFIDPFDLYGLDTDAIPNKIDPEDDYAKREIPDDAWDAFRLTKLDRLGLLDENISSLRGYSSANVPRLPSRLDQFASWIAKVSHEPAAVWWAIRQGKLHPQLLRQIGFWLEKKGEIKISEPVRSAWRFILDSWQREQRDSDTFFQLADDIRINGWNSTAVRQFADIALPYIKVERPFSDGPIAPVASAEIEVSDLVSLDVEYPDPPHDMNVPNEFLLPLIGHLRRNLEMSIQLETEIGGYGLGNISPIIPDHDSDDGDQYGRTQGLSAWMLYHVKLLESLLELDPPAALREFERWDSTDHSVFARLRLWALGKSTLITPEKFATVVGELSDDVFWGSDHARDLLLAVAARWDDLDDKVKEDIESRILKGPSQREKEDVTAHSERRAWSALNRLNWMKLNGCVLLMDVDARTAELRGDAPRWKPEYAAREARSLEGRIVTVRTVTDPSGLADEPLANVLSKAKELSGQLDLDFTQHDPFLGLVQNRPVRAFAVLRRAAQRNEFPEWAWHTFLGAEVRKDDKVRFTALIANEFLKYQLTDIAPFIRSTADWFQKSTKALAGLDPSLFAKLLEKLISVLRELPPQSNSSIVRTSNEPDWTMESINSPTGDLAEALFDVPQRNEVTFHQGLDPVWQSQAEELLSLPGDLRRHALVIFSFQLIWLYWADPSWTETYFLNTLNSPEAEDRQAFWAGFLWRGRAHGYPLFKILKPQMLDLAKSRRLEKRGHAEALTRLIVSGWKMIDEATGERWVSDAELRDVLIDSDDEFRSRVLWQIERPPSDETESQGQWLASITHLLADVWPRQISIKSPKVSSRLCDFAFSLGENFALVAPLILPLLGKVGTDQLSLPSLRRSRDNVVDAHPALVLALLHAVLPDNARLWPYGIDATIGRIGNADNSLNSDERLLELRRIWNSR